MWAVRSGAMVRGGGAAMARWMSSGSPEVNVAVVGGSGYTGAELIRMLAGHPYAKVRRRVFACAPSKFSPPARNRAYSVRTAGDAGAGGHCEFLRGPAPR